MLNFYKIWNIGVSCSLFVLILKLYKILRAQKINLTEKDIFLNPYENETQQSRFSTLGKCL